MNGECLENNDPVLKALPLTTVLWPSRVFPHAYSTLLTGGGGRGSREHGDVTSAVWGPRTLLAHHEITHSCSQFDFLLKGNFMMDIKRP